MSGYMIGPNQFTASKPVSGLYVVSTPIGNLSDITLRALEILAAANVVACEDTRTSAKLLNRYAINAQRIAYHEHNADSIGPKLLERVAKGEVVALISDAGTPLVSDPGERLVAEARAKGLPVFPVPGPSAPIAALTASGLPTNPFTFAGFLPSKKGQRIAVLQSYKGAWAAGAGGAGTLVFFESPSRLTASLADMVETFGEDRLACVCREITKLHEDVRRAPLGELLDHYTKTPPKGEIVVLVGPPDAETNIDPEALLAELLETNSVSRAASEAAKLTGISKRDLYQQALAISQRLKKDGGN